MLEGYPIVWEFSVPFADIDMMQHVNNVAYLRWAETLRAEYFARVMHETVHGERGMIQASIAFSYERPLRYRDRIIVGCRIPRIGTRSWDFTYEVWCVDRRERAAHGTTSMVAYDFVAERTIPIPEDWRDAIATFEQGPVQRFS
ncbi:MAG: acyl-CoA thioesterase [Vulcanimicrobiaceae bacterium]